MIHIYPSGGEKSFYLLLVPTKNLLLKEEGKDPPAPTRMKQEIRNSN